MPKIHPSSIVDPAARIADSVEIGPFCVVGPNVTIGEDCRLVSHVTLTGNTTVGRGNTFFQGAVIGEVPQDLKYTGEDSRLEIGVNNVFREYCTVNPGTAVAGGVTRVGSGNLIMTGVHIAHDCIVTDKNIIANQAQLAGHITVGPCAMLGGATAYHQFVTIGRGALVEGGVRVRRDVPPYLIMAGEPSEPRGINEIGMQRQGFTAEQIAAMRPVFKALFINRKGKAIRKVCEELLNDKAINGPAREVVEYVFERLDLPNWRLAETRRTDQHIDRSRFYQQPGK